MAKSRGLLGTRKVGHSGTLDPDATGVLLLGVGSVTRVLRYLTAMGKTYRGELVLGTTTSTLDSSGTVTATFDMTAVTEADVRAAAAAFVGAIEQIPPMVSAIKIEGRRLHELAREGIEVERAPRPVTVHALEIAPTADPAVYLLTVSCSSGTYIRTLADDIGRALDGGGHLRNLRRLAVGTFGVDEACVLEVLGPDRLLTPAEALRDLRTIVVDDATVADLRHGRQIASPVQDALQSGPARAVDANGTLIAVLESVSGGRLRPVVVLPE